MTLEIVPTKHGNNPTIDCQLSETEINFEIQTKKGLIEKTFNKNREITEKIKSS
jgi:hypothetical protein